MRVWGLRKGAREDLEAVPEAEDFAADGLKKRTLSLRLTE
jgi:hypothetical protein